MVNDKVGNIYFIGGGLKMRVFFFYYLKKKEEKLLINKTKILRLFQKVLKMGF